jgi:serine O-acetyltransferase
MKLTKNPISLYYLSRWLYCHHIPVLPKIVELTMFFMFNAVIPYTCKIGKECILGHRGMGIVLHPNVEIGEKVLIAHQVTIGGSGYADKVPSIGDDVYIGVGAKILGPIEIGSHCIIGANAVVVKSVPSNCVVAGVPARIIKENIDPHTIENW